MSVEPQPLANRPAVGRDSLEIRLLGPLEVRRSGETVSLGGALPRALLALLSLNRAVVVSNDLLVDQLWGESPPPTARHMVAVYISSLRKRLGDGVLLTRAPGYVLVLDPEHLDIARFEWLLASGRQALAERAPAPAAAALNEALGLWRGPALLDFAYEPFAQEAIAKFEELRLLAEEERIEAELALGGGAALVPEIETLVATAPLRERRHAQLMLALYRSGRQSEALSVYRDARRTLIDELGIEPGSELRELERAILAQEERLLAESPPARAPPAELETRRPVTVVVADLVEAADSVEDPEAIRALRRPGLERLRETVARYGGSADELPDGSAFAVFGSPLAHEDDGIRALRAADELRKHGIVSRAGIETGEALIERGLPPTGQLVRSAAQLRDHALQGEIVLCPATRRLVSEVAVVDPLERRTQGAWRLREVNADAPTRELQLDAPFVGRDRELAVLCDAFSRSAEDSSALLVTVLGEPGIGKSRLAHEFAERVAGEARVLVGRCLAYGEGISYRPLKDVLRQLRIHEGSGLKAVLADNEDGSAIADRVDAVLGDAELPYRVEEIRWASRRLFEALAREQPLVLVFEDLHWADPNFVDLLQHVVETSRHAAILVLCLARSEFREERPGWELPDERGTMLTLEALGVAAAEKLVSSLDRARSLTTEWRASLIDAAQGNPLFLEQLVAFAHERGIPGDLDVPPTLRALLTARLDRLGPGERAVLECAAVVGREFWAGAVGEILPPDARSTFRRHLTTLSRREFTEPAPSAVPFEDTFRFRHVLIQESAYRSLSKARRGELHQRLATLLERMPTGQLADEDEIVGHHLEQAYVYRAELGPIDEPAQALAEGAADRLDRAGRRALVRGDAAAAVNLLDRSRRLLSHHPRRLELSVSLAEALVLAGELGRSLQLLEETIEEGKRCGDLRSEWLAAVQHAHVGKLLSPRQWPKERITQTAEQGIRVFEALEDQVGLTRGQLLLADVCFDECRYDAAANHFRRAVEHARRAGDEREELLALNALHASLYFGTTHVDVARAQAEALLARAQGLPGLEARVLLTLAGLEAMNGGADESRALYLRAKSIADELGLRQLVATAPLFTEEVGLLFGDAVFAERELRAGHEELEAIGEKGVRSTVAAHLAEALYQLGRHREAERFADVALTIASRNDIATQARGRAVKAKLLAARQDFDGAERLGRKAVALAADTDDLFMHGQVLFALAEVLLLARRHDEARPVLETVAEVSTRKGDVMTTGRAWALLTDLGGSA